MIEFIVKALAQSASEAQARAAAEAQAQAAALPATPEAPASPSATPVPSPADASEAPASLDFADLPPLGAVLPAPSLAAPSAPSRLLADFSREGLLGAIVVSEALAKPVSLRQGPPLS